MLYRRKYPWVGQQTWKDIVFLHWPVAKKNLRPFVPDPFTICEYNDSAWVTIVYFNATETKGRKHPTMFMYPDFKQVNLRTYVQFGAEMGVYFFSLFANDSIVVTGGKLFGLPYKYLPISREKDFETDRLILKDVLISEATQKDQPFQPKENTLEHFLTEKYCIWLVKGKRILKAPVSHLPWTIHEIDVQLKTNWFISSELQLHDDPIAHYSSFMTAYLHPFETFGYYHP